MLSIDQKNEFFATVRKLSQELVKSETKNTFQELELFENQLTLNELKDCFVNLSPEDCETKLISFLAKRWERVRGSSMCYTQKPANIVNQLCLNIARVLSPPVTTASEIDALKPKTGPYFLLMPSLENDKDVYLDNIHSLQLHEFVLSDKERVFIPLVRCLERASISDVGQLSHVVEIDEDYPMLTPNEVQRVTRHSKQATKLYESILALNKQRLLGDDIGAKLTQLAVALRAGGARRGGAEYNSGFAANIGIVNFYAYWNKLSEQRKAAIFAESPMLRDIIGRLFRPRDADFRETRFCVEILARELDSITHYYNQKPSIQMLKEKVKKHQKALESALESPQNFIIVQNSSPPKHILHLIFKLSLAEQKKLFKYDGYENALMYALAHDPDALPAFELDEELKRQAVEAKIKPHNDSGLIIASKHGSIAAIKLLLSWGADLHSPDTNGSDALHWAVYHGHKPIVEYLLRQNADINARNNAGQNALDIAIARHPELVEPILMQLASLPTDKQKDCLCKRALGSYPNVLFYAAYQKPSLFNALITTIIDQGIKHDHPLFTTANHNGLTPLLLAAQLGASESINKLIDLGLDIESKDTDGNTALTWAARKGHVDAVGCLLEKGASLEARGWNNNTPLNLAVYYGHKLTVEFLLPQNADINARNKARQNALDIAIAIHPELVEPILMQLASLPADKQKECLCQVARGLYPNVLFYAAYQKRSWFNALITRIIKQGITHDDALFTTANHNGLTPLLLAAQLGASESIKKLLDLGLDIESKDKDGNTALAFAAISGHVDAVGCLLEKGALLEARGCNDNTPLNLAVCHGRKSTVNFLLRQNADINARNKEGQNALDIAIERHPELVEPILMQLASLPADKQKDCLLKVASGPYPNVFFYAATVDASLLKKLLCSLNNNEALNSKMQAILDNIHQIGSHYQKMAKKYHANANYYMAALAAKTLLETCIDETLKIYQSREQTDENILVFKENLAQAIITARPVLSKYREWGWVLAKFLLALVILPISMPLYTVGFFSVKTKSEQLLDNLQFSVNKLSNPLV